MGQGVTTAADAPSAIPAEDPSGLSPTDLEQLRADTPGATIVHHLNNAGSALPPQVVLDVMIGHLQREAQIGGYEAHAEVQPQLDETYVSLGRLVGSGPEGISLTTSATDSWVRGFLSIPLAAGDRLLVSQAEYASNVLAIMAAAKRVGATIDAIPDDSNGIVDVDALTDMLDERVKVVSITHAPSQNGLLNPAAEIGQALHAAGSSAWYILDACQSVGQMPLEAQAIGADFISATGRKFLRGPRGTGFLWASKRALELEPAIIDLHAAEWTAIDDYAISPGATRYESLEKSYAAMLGMGAAADYALNLGLDVIQRRITWLADRIRQQLAATPGVEVRDRGEHRTGIVVFCAPGRDTEALVTTIKSSGVNVSFSPQNYARRDFGEYGAGEPTGYVRVSPHVYNDDSDIDALIDVVRRSVRS